MELKELEYAQELGITEIKDSVEGYKVKYPFNLAFNIDKDKVKHPVIIDTTDGFAAIVKAEGQPHLYLGKGAKIYLPVTTSESFVHGVSCVMRIFHSSKLGTYNFKSLTVRTVGYPDITEELEVCGGADFRFVGANTYVLVHKPSSVNSYAIEITVNRDSLFFGIELAKNLAESYLEDNFSASTAKTIGSITSFGLYDSSPMLSDCLDWKPCERLAVTFSENGYTEERDRAPQVYADTKRTGEGRFCIDFAFKNIDGIQGDTVYTTVRESLYLKTLTKLQASTMALEEYRSTHPHTDFEVVNSDELNKYKPAYAAQTEQVFSLKASVQEKNEQIESLKASVDATQAKYEAERAERIRKEQQASIYNDEVNRLNNIEIPLRDAQIGKIPVGKPANTSAWDIWVS